MTDDEFRRLVSVLEWREAKSYRLTMPHEWARPHYATFDGLRRFIRANTNSLTLNGHQAWADDGIQFWTIWPVINRVDWCHTHQGPVYKCIH